MILRRILSAASAAPIRQLPLRTALRPSLPAPTPGALPTTSRLLTTSAPLFAPPRTKNAGQNTASVLSTLKVAETQFKTYKPITPGRRHLRRPISAHLFKGRPVRALTVAQRKTGGRNSHGRVTVRGRGGGHKRRLRIVDFMRMEEGVQDVIRIEYDPGRSSHIALIKSRNPASPSPFSYILACEGLRAGDTVQSFRMGIPDGFVPGFVDRHRWSAKDTTEDTAAPPSPSINVNPAAPQTVASPSAAAIQAANASQAAASLSLGVLRALTVKPGNVLPLRLIPTGTLIHSVSLKPKGRGILIRSAGSFGQIVAHDDAGKWTQVKLQSGEVRHVLQSCCATIGKVSNPDWKNRSLGKAGRNRWLGRRPKVRGVAMNACDHPHGGGRGKSKGNKHPRSVWGWLTKGKRTRKPGPKGNTMVVRERPRGKERNN